MLERLATKPSKIARRKQAIATLAGMVGALILARAVDDEDLSNEILSVAADGLDP
jgi:TetR/AcrR family transcriptional repressor of nem operon